MIELSRSEMLQILKDLGVSHVRYIKPDERVEWGRHRDLEWYIAAGVFRVHFCAPGRIAAKAMFAPASSYLDIASDIVEIPGVTQIQDESVAIARIREWAAMTPEQRVAEIDKFWADAKAAQFEEHRRNATKDLPVWGHTHGGTWTRHVLVAVVRVEEIKRGPRSGFSQIVYRTACGKEGKFQWDWSDAREDVSKKPLCEICQPHLPLRNPKANQAAR